MWLPSDAADNPVPAILEYLPYRKRGGTESRDALTHPWFAAHGYACLRVDIRGNGESDGLMEDEYTERELADGVEVIDWIAGQPWCTGAVGMMGISWGGFNALQIAALRPDALKAIITLCSTDDRYSDDIHYKGGCLLNENLGWGSTMLSYSSRPPDPAIVGEQWRRTWLERLGQEPLLPAVWLAHQTRDDFWKHGSVCEHYSQIEAPMLAIGGWADAYKNAVRRLVDNIDAPTKGIVGPWLHKYPHFAVPLPRIGFLQEALRWWDRWLKQIDTGVEEDPPFRAYLMDSVRPRTSYDHRPGRWIASDDWPPRSAARRVFALGGHGRLDDLGGAPRVGGGNALGGSDGVEARNPTHSDDYGGHLAGIGTRGFRTDIASPQHCGADAGEYCGVWLGPDMPGDQRHDDSMSACFDTEPIERELSIVGAPQVELTLCANTSRAQIAVRLNDVWPDGATTRITYGVLNLCHRSSHETPEPLIAGQDYTITLSLDDVAYTLPAGHRLRIAISTAYWPLIWPSPEPTMVTLSAGTVVLHDIAGIELDGVAFEQAETAPPHETVVLEDPTNSRIVETNQKTGLVTTTINDNFGRSRNSADGLESGGTALERWTILPDDPLSARGYTEWTQTLRRDGWETTTTTTVNMCADGENFYLGAKLVAYENGGVVLERAWNETIPRNFV